MDPRPCPVCAALMQTGLANWHFCCPSCGYEQGQLEDRINDSVAHRTIDEGRRAQGLKELRQENFGHLLTILLRCRLPGRRLLEVGSAHGWFLSLAGQAFDAQGVEPDAEIREASGLADSVVRGGFFPQALGANERFDVIVFNDVFEHIPNPAQVLCNVRQHLNPDGLLLLNLPSSRGIFYRLARGLNRWGRSEFFDRMWQKGMPSPHLHYFHQDNLEALLLRQGYQCVAAGTLPSVRYKGLWSRVSYDRQGSRLSQAVIWCLVTLGLPLFRQLPADIMYVVAKPVSIDSSKRLDALGVSIESSAA